MFTTLYGWRKWRNQRTQWFLLVLGFALFTTLLTLLLQLGARLLDDRPAWVESSAEFVTIGRKNVDGQLTLIAGNELRKIAKLPQVEEVSRTVHKVYEVKLGEQKLGKLPIVFYSSNFSSMLAPQHQFTSVGNAGTTEQAYVSWEFWQSHLKDAKDTDVLRLSLNNSERKYRIAGVVPSDMTNFGLYRPAIWLAESEFVYSSPIRFSNGDGSQVMDPEMQLAMTRSMVENLPFYLGVARLNQSASPIELEKSFANLEETPATNEVRMIEAKETMWILPGLEFNPKEREYLIRQWWLLLILTLGFGLVNIVNLSSIAASQLISRNQEFEIRIAMGARSLSVFSQLLIEQLPMSLAVLILGASGYALLQMQLMSVPVYQSYFGDNGIQTDWGLWFMGTSLVLLVICLCNLLPALRLLRGASFSRGRISQRTKRQQWFSQAIGTLQICIALFSLSMMGGMLLQEWKQQDYTQIDNTLREFKVESQQSLSITPELAEGRPGSTVPLQSTVSSSSFVSPLSEHPTLSIAGLPNEQKFSARRIAVAPNYFGQLGIPMLTPEAKLDQESVIINQSTADSLLQGKEDYSTLLGQRLNLDAMEKQELRILGVVANAPHFGIHNMDVPVVYTHIGKPAKFSPHQLYFLTPHEQSGQFAEVLNSWLRRESIEAKITENGSIGLQLDRLNAGNILLFNSVSFMTLIILGIVFIGVMYQVSGQLMMQVARYGTQLALGAPHHVIRFNIAWRMLALSLAAIPLTLLMIKFIAPHFTLILGAQVFSAPAALLAFVLISLLVQIAASYPTRKLLQQPISELLRYHP